MILTAAIIPSGPTLKSNHRIMKMMITAKEAGMDPSLITMITQLGQNTLDRMPRGRSIQNQTRRTVVGMDQPRIRVT